MQNTIMQDNIKVTIRLFGAFRKYGDVMELTLPTGCAVADIKAGLAEKLAGNDAALVTDSAIANDNEIIAADTVFTADATLAILPPVCGG